MRYILPLLALAAFTATASADNWPSWRGPGQTGVAAEGTYPTTWSETENVAFKAALPGRGSSTPAVWGEQIFLTAAEPEGGNLVMALDRGGQLLWAAPLGESREGKNRKATGANPSPVTDGEHVFVYFKSGDLACLDTKGKILWQHNLQDQYGEDTLWWDLGTSPVLTEKYVVVAVMQSGPSYLVAYEKESGKLAWKHDRKLPAPEESAQSYSTPIVASHDGREVLIVLGADHVTCHDTETGAEIWRLGGLNPTGHKYFRSIASPVVADGTVVAPYGRGATLVAIRLGGEGDVTESHRSWTAEGDSPDVPTPAAAGGKVYVLSDKGLLRALDLKSGKLLAHVELEQNRNSYSASPILAGGHVYCTREDGVTFVVKVGDTLEVVAKNELAERTVATPVAVDGKIYLRTYESLYCIGK